MANKEDANKKVANKDWKTHLIHSDATRTGRLSRIGDAGLSRINRAV